MLKPLVLTVLFTESVSFTLKGYTPAVVAGPAVIDVVLPDAALSANPGGSGFPGTMDHV